MQTSFSGLATNQVPKTAVTPAWKKQISEADELVFSTRHDASVAQSNTVPAAEIDDEDETPDKRRRDDDVAGAESNTTEAADMDEDETPAKRLRYEAAVPRVTPAQIQQQTYWDSTEAMIQFSLRRRRVRT
jgi:hypothetical protein